MQLAASAAPIRRVPKEAIVFLAAALARTLAFFGARADPAFQALRFDETDYFALAGFIDDPLRGAYSSAMSPGYVAFLRQLPGASTHGLPVVAGASLLLGALTQVLTFRIAKRFSNEAAALAATLAASLLAPTIFYELRPLPEASSSFCVVAFATLMLEARRYRVAAYALAGAFAAWAAMARGSNAVLIAGAGAHLFAVWMSRRSRKGFALIAAFVAGTSAAFFSHSGPALATSGGVNFYIGNGDDADGTWRPPRDLDVRGESPRLLFAAATASAHAHGETDVNRYFVDRTLRSMRAAPGRAVRLLFTKAVRMVGREEVADNRDFSYERRFNFFLRSPFALDSSLLVAFGLPGLFLLVWTQKRDRWLLALCGFVLPAATMLVFFVVGRYRVTWFPWLAIGAARTLTILAAAVRKPTPRDAALGASVLVVFLVALLHGPSPTTARSHYLRAYDLHVVGQLDLALAEYDRAYEMARAEDDVPLRAEVEYNRAAAVRLRDLRRPSPLNRE